MEAAVNDTSGKGAERKDNRNKIKYPLSCHLDVHVVTMVTKILY